MAHVAAIQNGISLSDGHGLLYEWNDETGEAYATGEYEGSSVAPTNDNRKRPLVWSRRHCRMYTDPYGGSFERMNKDDFEIFLFKHGSPHPEYDDYLHMGSYLGAKEADAIRRNGMVGNADVLFSSEV